MHDIIGLINETNTLLIRNPKFMK